MSQFIWSEFENKYFNADMMSEVYARIVDESMCIVSCYIDNELENLRQFDDIQTAEDFIKSSFDIIGV